MARRVLHFITELEVGGAERLLVATLPRLDRSKFDVSVACLHGDDLRPELERAGIRVTRLKSRRKFDPGAFAQLVRLLRDERIEILHTHLIQADLLGYFAARRARVPSIVSTKHNTNYFQAHGACLPPIDRFVNRRLSRIVAVSDAVKTFYVETQRLAAERIEVIHNGIDLAAFREAAPASRAVLAVKPTEAVVCCVGNLKEKKGHHVLLRAWPDVISRRSDARLVLVGDGPLRDRLREAANLSGVRETIRFLGNRSDVASILRAADLFVLPSLWEGFGIVVVEAMAAGVPVIASRVDGVCEVVRDGQDGVLVPPNDPGRLAEAIVAMLNDAGRARSLAATAQKRAEAFSIEETARKLERLYDTLG